MQVLLPIAFKKLNIDEETARLIEESGAHLIFCVADRAQQYWLMCDVASKCVSFVLVRSIRDVLQHILSLKTPCVVKTRSAYLRNLAQTDIDDAPDSMKKTLRKLEKVSIEELSFQPLIQTLKNMAETMLQSNVKLITYL